MSDAQGLLQVCDQHSGVASGAGLSWFKVINGINPAANFPPGAWQRGGCVPGAARPDGQDWTAGSAQHGYRP